MEEYDKCDNCTKTAIFFLKSTQVIRCYKCHYENYKLGTNIKLCDVNCGRFKYNWACYDYKFKRVHNFVEIEAIYTKEDECKICEQPYFPRATFVGTISADNLCNHCDEIKNYDFKLNKNIFCSDCPSILFKEDYVISLCSNCYFDANANNNNSFSIWKIEEYSSSESNDIVIDCKLNKPMLCSECFVIKKNIKNKN